MNKGFIGYVDDILYFVYVSISLTSTHKTHRRRFLYLQRAIHHLFRQTPRVQIYSLLALFSNYSPLFLSSPLIFLVKSLLSTLQQVENRLILFTSILSSSTCVHAYVHVNIHSYYLIFGFLAFDFINCLDRKCNKREIHVYIHFVLFSCFS